MEPKHLSALMLQSSKSLGLAYPSLLYSRSKASRWNTNQLLVIPALRQEIDWTHPTRWPRWLRQGLPRFNGNMSRPYEIYLYQRMDPKSAAPYDWPYCSNVYQEVGVFLKFINDFYDDLPDTMLFISGDSFVHSAQLIGAAQCVRDDVHFLRLNSRQSQNRSWSMQRGDLKEKRKLAYECVGRLLTRFGFDGGAQLNLKKRRDQATDILSPTCCTSFYVTKERIRHYKREQWSSLFRANRESVCSNIIEGETKAKARQEWFAYSLEHLWDIILILDSPSVLPFSDTITTTKCHFFRSSCTGSTCTIP